MSYWYFFHLKFLTVIFVVSDGCWLCGLFALLLTIGPREIGLLGPLLSPAKKPSRDIVLSKIILLIFSYVLIFKDNFQLLIRFDFIALSLYNLSCFPDLQKLKYEKAFKIRRTPSVRLACCQLQMCIYLLRLYLRGVLSPSYPHQKVISMVVPVKVFN